MSPFPSSADSEGRAYRNASPGLRFFLTGTLSLALMFVDHRGTYLKEIRAYLGEAFYPVQIAIDSPAAALRWTRENLALRRQLIAENAKLRQESLTAGVELQRLAALRVENARFRALLDSKARVPNRVVVGEILSVDMDPLRHRVILNKGSLDGAYEGQALIDARGVVGQITRDQRDSSAALLITDPDHALPVEVVRNGLRSIAVGTGDLQRLSLPFLTRNADIKAGDLLVTSGLGGAFPAGYPVGRVTQVDGSSGDAFLEVSAVPTADLDRLHEVLLVFLQQSVAARAAPAAVPRANAADPKPTPVATPTPTPTLAPVTTPAAIEVPTTTPPPATTEVPTNAPEPVVETAPNANSASAPAPGESLPEAPDPTPVPGEPEGVQE